MSRPPCVVVVEGEAGVGKTRLVEEAVAGLGAAGTTLLVGRCLPLREPLPLAPLLDAVRGLGDRLSSLKLGPVSGALVPLLPELAAHLPEALISLGDPAVERHRTYRALLEV
ncbi:MAG: AAA family ATPase, partial [Acidimicrobiales bacterium]